MLPIHLIAIVKCSYHSITHILINPLIVPILLQIRIPSPRKHYLINPSHSFQSSPRTEHCLPTKCQSIHNVLIYQEASQNLSEVFEWRNNTQALSEASLKPDKPLNPFSELPEGCLFREGKQKRIQHAEIEYMQCHRHQPSCASFEMLMFFPVSSFSSVYTQYISGSYEEAS